MTVWSVDAEHPRSPSCCSAASAPPHCAVIALLHVRPAYRSPVMSSSAASAVSLPPAGRSARVAPPRRHPAAGAELAALRRPPMQHSACSSRASWRCTRRGRRQSPHGPAQVGRAPRRRPHAAPPGSQPGGRMWPPLCPCTMHRCCCMRLACRGSTPEPHNMVGGGSMHAARCAVPCRRCRVLRQLTKMIQEVRGAWLPPRASPHPRVSLLCPCKPLQLTRMLAALAPASRGSPMSVPPRRLCCARARRPPRQAHARRRARLRRRAPRRSTARWRRSRGGRRTPAPPARPPPTAAAR